MTFCLNSMFEILIHWVTLPICIDSIPLKKVNVVNFLGVYIDCNLKWDTHVNNINCKVSRCISILFNLKYYLSDHALFSLYNASVLPHLSYCVSVWGNCGKLKMNILFKLQKKYCIFVPVAIILLIPLLFLWSSKPWIYLMYTSIIHQC